MVNGNIRLPRPAAGITAFLNIGADIHKSLSSLDAIYARPQPSCAVPRLSNNRIYRRNNIIVKTPAEVCATSRSATPLPHAIAWDKIGTVVAALAFAYGIVMAFQPPSHGTTTAPKGNILDCLFGGASSQSSHILFPRGPRWRSNDLM